MAKVKKNSEEPATRKLSTKKKTATLDLSVPLGYEVEKSWQAKDASKVLDQLSVELAKKNELFIITIRGPREEEEED